MKQRPIVIAHRGACGYLPEHTLPCKAAAHMTDPDYIEQDVAITADGRAVVIHDHHLDDVTDVELAHPARRHPDGHFYAIDFTLSEMKGLRVHERTDPHTGEPAYPERFPLKNCLDLRVHTLEEEIELIRGMNRSRNKDIGLYVELKAPRFHREHGVDIARMVLEVLARYGYDGPESNCIMQCFDPETIRYMRRTLGSSLRMVQLIADNSWNETPGVDYAAMLTGPGLDDIAGYADAIGPWIEQVITDMGPSLQPLRTGIAAAAHERGLQVHAYTARLDALPSWAVSAEELYGAFYLEEGVDGLFSDFPDQAVGFLERHGLR